MDNQPIAVAVTKANQMNEAIDCVDAVRNRIYEISSKIYNAPTQPSEARAVQNDICVAELLDHTPSRLRTIASEMNAELDRICDALF
ncbi:hypothetical protein KAR91_23645 [Candidatus Pacearchaeota archaeon]|nr:hypothetical protein [Candidatus Pacearchaeota archaeon]